MGMTDDLATLRIRNTDDEIFVAVETNESVEERSFKSGQRLTVTITGDQSRVTEIQITSMTASDADMLKALLGPAATTPRQSSGCFWLILLFGAMFVYSFIKGLFGG